jgi:hypothetical protein
MLRRINLTLKVEVVNITDLRFVNESFKYILAFGFYHNLEHGLDQSIEETCHTL